MTDFLLFTLEPICFGYVLSQFVQPWNNLRAVMELILANGFFVTVLSDLIDRLG